MWYDITITDAAGTSVILTDSSLNSASTIPTLATLMGSFSGSVGITPCFFGVCITGSSVQPTLAETLALIAQFWSCIQTMISSTSLTFGVQVFDMSWVPSAGVLNVFQRLYQAQSNYSYGPALPMYVSWQVETFNSGELYYAEITAGRTPANAPGANVTINGRRWVSMSVQGDMSPTGIIAILPMQNVGQIIGPSNPSCVDFEMSVISNANVYVDLDIDLQDGQDIFTPVGTIFTGTSGGY